MAKLELYKSKVEKVSHSRRNDKIASQIRECFSKELIRGNLHNIPSSVITITHVDVSPDLRNAMIFIMPLGGEKLEETINFLEKNKHYFKNIIATKMKMRFIPDITFRADDAIEYSQKIEKLINEDR